MEVPGVDSNFIVSQWEGLQNKVGNTATLLYAKGCDIEGNDRTGFAEAIGKLQKIGCGHTQHRGTQGYEQESQEPEQYQYTGRAGRPAERITRYRQARGGAHQRRPALVFDYTAEHAPAILYTWWLGSEAAMPSPMYCSAITNRPNCRSVFRGAWGRYPFITVILIPAARQAATTIKLPVGIQRSFHLSPI